MSNEHDGSDATNGPVPIAESVSDAERARTLLEAVSTGTLCTLTRELSGVTNANLAAGHPYGSLVPFALDEHRPIFLLSELAEHTQNLRSDARASLLVSDNRQGDALANARVTLLGAAVPVSEARRESARQAYLARHPGAASHVSFGDFSFWTLTVSAARHIGGYGRMSWVSAEDWQSAKPDPIAPHARAILEHMNQDHADALPVYVRAFSSVGEVMSAEMTGIDRLGFEIDVVTAQGPRSVRLTFRAPSRARTRHGRRSSAF